MKKMLFIGLLSLGFMSVHATEIEVQSSGVDPQEAEDNAKKLAVEKYQSQLMKNINACKSIDTKFEIDMDDYDISALSRDNTATTANGFNATYRFDVEANDGVDEKLDKACQEKSAEIKAAQLEAERERREAKKSEKEWNETKNSINDFGSRFNIGAEIYGLLGYGANGYFEYRHNEIFSISAIGGYSAAYNNFPTVEDPSKKSSKLSLETLSAGVEVRLLFVYLAYEQLFDYKLESGFNEINTPTNAISIGLLVPLDTKMAFQTRETPRLEYGIYYKRFNDKFTYNGEEYSDSDIFGLALRVRIY